MWKDDFVVDGKCLKMWHQKFVESVAKHKHHAEPPAYYAEYNDLINYVTDFANANYNIKASQKENQQHCKEILKEYRINCEKELNSLIEKINKEDLSVVHSNPNDFMKLAKYVLKQNDIWTGFNLEVDLSEHMSELKTLIIKAMIDKFFG